LTLLVGRQEGHRACKKTERWGAGMVICLERGADLHMSQLMPLPLTLSCFSKIQIGFTFLVPADLGIPGKKGPLNVCVCVIVTVSVRVGAWLIETLDPTRAAKHVPGLVGVERVSGQFVAALSPTHEIRCSLSSSSSSFIVTPQG